MCVVCPKIEPKISIYTDLVITRQNMSDLPMYASIYYEDAYKLLTDVRIMMMSHHELVVKPSRDSFNRTIGFECKNSDSFKSTKTCDIERLEKIDFVMKLTSAKHDGITRKIFDIKNHLSYAEKLGDLTKDFYVDNF